MCSARCVIDLAPDGTQGTIIRMRGGLGSENDIENNPAFPKACPDVSRRERKRFLAGVRNARATRPRRARSSSALRTPARKRSLAP